MSSRNCGAPARLGLLLWIAGAATVVAASSFAAETERLSLDWVFSEEGKTATAIPRYAWLGSGDVLLYDPRLPKAERTLESFDPKTGERTKRVDAARAVASLTELVESDEPIEELGWPSATDQDGTRALYERGGDVFLLDLASSTFVAVAATEAAEKSPRFSPDGTKIAFVRSNDLWVYDVPSAETRRLTGDGSDTVLNGTTSWVYWEEIFGRHDRGYVWSPDGTAIAYLQSDESVVPRMTFVDFAPAVPRVIHQRYPKAGEANPRVRAGVLDLESGKTTWVDLGVYPYEYLVRVSWLPDGTRLAVQTLDRSQTRLDLFVVDAATGRPTHVLRETDDGWVNVHDDLHFLDGGERFLWLSERDGFAHLYLYELDGTLVRRITEGEWSLRSSGGPPALDRAVVHVDEDGGHVWFTALEKSSVERHLYRVALDGSDLRRLSRLDGAHRILFRDDGAYYLDASSSTKRMPELAVHDANGTRVASIAEPRSETLERFDLQAPELFTIAARDGFPMPARIIRPRGFDPAKKYPVVLYVYGGPSAPTVSDSWGGRARDYFEQMLADRGFVVMRFDNRTATGKSKRLENLVVHEVYGTTELDDLLDAVGWLKSLPYVDAERIGIWGWSGGGSFTLLAMTRTKEFHAGVAVAAVSDWHYYDTKWTESFMKRPQDNPEGYESTSHATRAKDLHGRLLLVHGTYDDNVHPQHAWRFADELIEAGITFDMMIYPMRKHGIRDDEAQKHLYKTMLEFWQRQAEVVATSK